MTPPSQIDGRLHFDLDSCFKLWTHKAPVQSRCVQTRRGAIRFTMRPLPACIRLIGPPAGPSGCPSSSSNGTLLLGDAAFGDAFLTSQQTAFWRTSRICRACEKRAQMLTVRLLDIHEEAEGISPAALAFTRRETLKMFGEEGWRNRGGPWGVEGSLISLQTTQDTVESFDTPDSKGDL